MNRHRKWMRMKRARRTRKHIQELKLPRLCVHRTPRHIYAQVLSDDGTRTVASASTVEKNVRLETKYGGNCRAAELVGRLVAERAILAGVERVAFDRSGFKFHGRVAALAKSAREAGLVF